MLRHPVGPRVLRVRAIVCFGGGKILQRKQMNAAWSDFACFHQSFCASFIGAYSGGAR